MNIDEIMRAAPVIPVLVLAEEMDWAALAETFVAAGLPVLEVTLRTPAALDAIRAAATLIDIRSESQIVQDGVIRMAARPRQRTPSSEGPRSSTTGCRWGHHRTRCALRSERVP